MNCETAQGHFSEYYDGELAAAERGLVDEHLRDCPACRGEYEHYTTSLKVLHDSKTIETTQVFLANFRNAAMEDLKRPAPGAAAPPRKGGSPWVPWALAGVMIAAFTAGYLVADRGRQRDARELESLRKEARKPPRVVEIPARVDEEKILKDHGILRVGDRLVPAWMQEAFDAGKVCVAGEFVTRKEAAKKLAGELPKPPVPDPPSVPSAEQILEKRGFVLVDGRPVRKSSLERWARGEVQTGIDKWKRPSDFVNDFIREQNLVEMHGKYMTREQADALQARQFVRRPDTGTATNEVTRALEGLRIGPPMTFKGMTVYPLMAKDSGKEPGFVTLHEVQVGEGIEIVETGGLFAVEVRSRLKKDLLLLAGDLLAGGRCMRAVGEDTVVAAGRKASVPVLCVEPGAWRSSERFARESGHYLAPPSWRRSLIWEQGQGAFWSMLSGGSGLAALFRGRVAEIADYRYYFTELPDREAEAVGVAVAAGNALCHVELFGSQVPFAANFDRILAGAALDLLERPEEEGPAAHPNSVRGVKGFLEGAFSLVYERRKEGYGLKRGDARVGRACVGGGRLRHAVFFASGEPEWNRRAARSIPRVKLARALKEYEARLKGSGKAAVLAEIGSLGVAEAVPLLANSLGDAEASVRQAAARELGRCGGRGAVDALLKHLPKARKDLPLYREVVRALARLGDERAVDPLFKQVEAGGVETMLVVVEALPDLLLTIRTRAVLTKAVGGFISLYEAVEAAAQGDPALSPVVRELTRAAARRLSEASRVALQRLTGKGFDAAAGYRGWWNLRENRERFLKERTGR